MSLTPSDWQTIDELLRRSATHPTEPPWTAATCRCPVCTRGSQRHQLRRRAIAAASTVLSVAKTVAVGTGLWWWADQAWKAIR